MLPVKQADSFVYDKQVNPSGPFVGVALVSVFSGARSCRSVRDNLQ